MRTAICLLLILGIAVVSAIFLLPRPLSPAIPVPTVVHSQGPTVERLERLSHLATTRVYVVDVLVGQGEGCRGAWLIKGDALVGVNLSQARIVEMTETTKQATILLPPPEVLQPRVDHERTKTWEVRRMVWLPWNADADRLRDEVMRQAQQLVAHAAGSDENLQQAKLSAATIVTAFYEEVGWQVQVGWKDTSTAGK
ncbi:MAG: DUF4230 domain-containing protein [Planctomycetes bacterium]|nr:DUF4230 domain-containing protein [Planctomycetota bacterium]